MCEEVNEEVAHGRKLAEDLVEHLETMGADSCGIPVETDGGCFLVKVIRTI